jgi:hypothetical protein
MVTSAETEWTILLQHGKPRWLGGFARQSAELQQFSYEISALKSRLIQGFETLSSILFRPFFK